MSEGHPDPGTLGVPWKTSLLHLPGGRESGPFTSPVPFLEYGPVENSVVRLASGMTVPHAAQLSHLYQFGAPACPDKFSTDGTRRGQSYF